MAAEPGCTGCWRGSQRKQGWKDELDQVEGSPGRGKEPHGAFSIWVQAGETAKCRACGMNRGRSVGQPATCWENHLLSVLGNSASPYRDAFSLGFSSF